MKTIEMSYPMFKCLIIRVKCGTHNQMVKYSVSGLIFLQQENWVIQCKWDHDSE